MSGSCSRSTKKRTRVLFLAWGFSIHAKRRIQIFVDDPSFEVAVVSTYNYEFERTANFLLKGVKKKDAVCRRISEAAAALKFLLSSSVAIKQELFLSRDFKRELVGQLRDFVSCRRLIGEIVRAAEDLKTLKAAFIAFKPDVIVLQTLLYPCYLAYYLPRSIPFIVTFWNGDLTWWAQWNGIERISKEALVRHGINRARAITVNSTAAYETCLNYGATKEKVHLVRYPGVELERFRPQAKNSARNDIGIVHEKVVLCPRGLGGYLNSDVIIEAVQEVLRRFPNTLFLFLSRKGDEKEWKKHLERARCLGVAENIRCDGQVPWEAMPTYYNASDVMISISSQDSLPNSLLEAMACEVPVITSNLCQMQEWITDGVNGFTVPPRNSKMLSDRIVEILGDGGEKSRIFGKHNSKLVTELADSKKNSEKIKELVHKVTEAGRIDSPDRYSPSRSPLKRVSEGCRGQV